MRIAMLGTRGVPAAYGGFETAVEEIGKRLVANGHGVTVYCAKGQAAMPRQHLGMDLVHVPAIRAKATETLSRTALSALHLAVAGKHDAAFVFNAANAPILPALRACRIPTAVHVDGLEWKRGKWGRTGQNYYRWAEQVAVRWADALISDAQGIADYYENEFGVPTELLTYGATILSGTATDRLTDLHLYPRAYHLVVARFEPENHVDLIVEGYHASGARHPLVVVGSAPYAAAYSDRIAAIAASDPRIRMLGGVWDQEQLNQLYAGALTYIHGHSVGGTNPSLLRAMGASTAVVAFDVGFNREVAGRDGHYFGNASALRRSIEDAERAPLTWTASGRRLQQRAESLFDWDAVAAGYEKLALRLVAGYSSRGLGGERQAHSAWSPQRVGPAPTGPALADDEVRLQ